MNQHASELDDLKEAFETFQKEVFEQQHAQVEADAERVREAQVALARAAEEAAEAVQACKEATRRLQPQTREQRAKLSEVQGKLQKAERRH